MLNGDCKGKASRNTYRVRTAVGKVMASIVCYSEGILLVEFRAMCADVREVTTKFSQTAIYQSASHHHFPRTAPRNNYCYMIV